MSPNFFKDGGQVLTPELTKLLGSIWAAFNSVNLTILWRHFTLKGVWEKFIPLTQPLYANNRNRIRAYGDVSPEFTRTSEVRHGCPISPFPFNLVIAMLVEVTVSSYEDSGIDVCTDRNLSELGYANNVALLNEGSSKLHVFLDHRTIAQVWLECVFHLQSVKCCCGTGSAQSRTLFL